MVIISTILGAALLISPIVLLSWVILRIHDAIFGPGFRNPAQAVPYLIRHFDRLTEKDFQKLEGALAKRRAHSEEAGIVYSLRVSLVVRRITNLKTLGSRWNVAWCGAGGRGLMLAVGSRNYKRVVAFLSEHYLSRFRKLATQMLDEAAAKELQTGRQGAVRRAREKIHEAQFEFAYPLDGLHEAAAAFKNLEQ